VHGSLAQLGGENNGTNGTNQLLQRLRAELNYGTGTEPGETDLEADRPAKSVQFHRGSVVGSNSRY